MNIEKPGAYKTRKGERAVIVGFDEHGRPKGYIQSEGRQLNQEWLKNGRLLDNWTETPGDIVGEDK